MKTSELTGATLILGIDAGSTTTKLVLITPDGKLLYQHYCSNKGQPLDIIASKLEEIYSLATPELNIKASAVTGYGEDLIKAGLGVDYGIVETVAHYKAAAYFCPLTLILSSTSADRI